jgi:hypothetical protein
MLSRNNTLGGMSRALFRLPYSPPPQAQNCKLLKNPFRQPIKFVVWWAGTITLFVVPARHRLADSIPGLLKRLQIRGQSRRFLYGFLRASDL